MAEAKAAIPPDIVGLGLSRMERHDEAQRALREAGRGDNRKRQNGWGRGAASQPGCSGGAARVGAEREPVDPHALREGSGVLRPGSARTTCPDDGARALNCRRIAWKNGHFTARCSVAWASPPALNACSAGRGKSVASLPRQGYRLTSDSLVRLHYNRKIHAPETE